MDLKIRHETLADHQEVYVLHNMAFGQEEESKLVDSLRKSEAFVPELSLVGVLGNRIVGHILFTKIKIEDNAGNQVESLALAPMAVLPQFQGKGIGGKLIQKGLEVAREFGLKSVIVLGHAEYYPKFGFVPTTRWDIKAPFDVPENAFMGIELCIDGLQNVTGTVQYP